MAVYGHSVSGWTPIAHADGATALVDGSYHALRTTAASTMRLIEVYIGGEATTGTVNRMAIRRLSTNGATPTNQTPGANNTLSGAAVSQGYRGATTGPTIASTAHLATPAFNAFGGIVRLVAPQGGEIYATASTAPNGELVLDSISGVGVVSTHIAFEEMAHDLEQESWQEGGAWCERAGPAQSMMAMGAGLSI